MSILDELVGKSIEAVWYDIEDGILTVQTEDERYWMFSITREGELVISIAEGIH